MVRVPLGCPRRHRLAGMSAQPAGRLEVIAVGTVEHHLPGTEGGGDLSMRKSFGPAVALAALAALVLGLGAGSASAQPASGNPPPPKGFEADSASFVSARAGFVLGARHCSRLPCKALLEKTANGGRTWVAVPAPAVSLTSPFNAPPLSAVSTVRFENARDGWLFNPGLWATSDGGRRWHRVSLPGEVIALAAADGMVFAAAEPVNGGLGAARLYRSKVGSTTWTRVAAVAPADALTVSGHSVWAGIAPELWRSTDSGTHWSKLPFRTPALSRPPRPPTSRWPATTRDSRSPGSAASRYSPPPTAGAPSTWRAGRPNPARPACLPCRPGTRR